MPDTSAYLILGYTAVVILGGGLILYLVLKTRGLQAELKMLETLEKEAPSEAASTAGMPLPTRPEVKTP
jgi:hypothetical protein